MVHRIGNGGGDTGQPDLANAARSELVDFLVRIVEEVHLDLPAQSAFTATR